mmetsp:Transcript_27463/g.38315  ORF Transcript_27463/g.38315 Transcript_27463/m.38315 type:complete len:497 (+) Transcript_27463:394-1884(+)
MHLESINFLKSTTKPLNFLISHYHMDHIGSLPLVLNYGNDKNFCYSTYLTKLLFFFNSKEFLNFTSRLKIKTYNKDDIEMTMELIISIKENDEKLLSNNIIVKFYNSGHSLGSSLINLSNGSLKMLYTGDYSKNDNLILKRVSYDSFNFDLLIIEDTLGGKNYLDGKRNERLLYKKILSLIYKKNCTIIFPVSSFVNMMNLLLILFKFMAVNKKKMKIMLINHKINDLKNNTRKLISYFNSEILNKNYGFDEYIYQIFNGVKSNSTTLYSNNEVIITSPNFFINKLSLSSCPTSSDHKFVFILTEFYQKFTVSSIINMKPIIVLEKSYQKSNKIEASNIFFYCHPSKDQIIEDLTKLNIRIINFVHITQKGAQRLFNLLKNNRRNLSNVEYIFCNKSEKGIQILKNSSYNIVLVKNSFFKILKVINSLISFILKIERHTFSYIELYGENKNLKDEKFFFNYSSFSGNRLITYSLRSKKLLTRLHTIILRAIIFLMN